MLCGPNSQTQTHQDLGGPSKAETQDSRVKQSLDLEVRREWPGSRVRVMRPSSASVVAEVQGGERAQVGQQRVGELCYSLRFEAVVAEREGGEQGASAQRGTEGAHILV